MLACLPSWPLSAEATQLLVSGALGMLLGATLAAASGVVGRLWR
jgi:hypothetical protein